MAKGSFSKIMWCMAAAGAAGILLAPFVFNGLTALGRSVEALETLRNLEFERVVYRTILIFAVLSLLPILLMGNLTHLRDVGWTGCPDWRRLWVRGLLAGVISILIIYGAGLLVGAYVWDLKPLARLVTKFFGYGIGALLVAVIEETLFRGILFTALRRYTGWKRAAVVSSLMYSLIHFAKPIPPFSTVHGEWDSAIRLIPHMFNVQGDLYHVFPFALTLFLLGIILAVAYYRTGSIYLSVGLHMGWVWAIRYPDVLLHRVAQVMPNMFSPGGALGKSYGALIMSAIFLLVLLWMYRSRSPKDA